MKRLCSIIQWGRWYRVIFRKTAVLKNRWQYFASTRLWSHNFHCSSVVRFARAQSRGVARTLYVRTLRQSTRTQRHLLVPVPCGTTDLLPQCRTPLRDVHPIERSQTLRYMCYVLQNTNSYLFIYSLKYNYTLLLQANTNQSITFNITPENYFINLKF